VGPSIRLGALQKKKVRSVVTCNTLRCKVPLKCDGTRAETRFRLSPKRTSPFKPAGASVQSTAGSRSVRISVSNAGYTTFRGSVRIMATHSIRQFPLHFPSRASPCAIRFQTHSTPANHHGLLLSVLHVALDRFEIGITDLNSAWIYVHLCAVAVYR